MSQRSKYVLLMYGVQSSICVVIIYFQQCLFLCQLVLFKLLILYSVYFRGLALFYSNKYKSVLIMTFATTLKYRGILNNNRGNSPRILSVHSVRESLKSYKICENQNMHNKYT